MTEKRKFMRFKANIPIEYRLCCEKEIDGMACAKEISREGMRFSIGRRLDRGTLLDIKIILTQDAKPVFLTGEVAWASESKEDFEYFVGIKFSRIDNFDRARILNHAYTTWLTSDQEQSVISEQ